MKEELRKKYKLVREEVKNEVKDLIIYEKVINSREFLNCDLVLIYISIGYEVDTIRILKKCFALNKKVAVPKCVNNNINFYVIESFADLEKGCFDIMEPITNNIVVDFSNSACFIPGIVFSEDGYRIGYGGGYYDRFLKNYDGKKIGLCYKECLMSDFEIEEFDQYVDIIICD